MRISDAIYHLPDKPTYAIRIASPGFNNLREFPLENSPLYVGISEYIFDDADDFYRPEWAVMFDEDIAGRVLQDFEIHRDGCESLLVHCSKGENRSPAVAIALNEIFGLGQDSAALKEQYPDSNWFVYKILKKVAEQK